MAEVINQWLDHLTIPAVWPVALAIGGIALLVGAAFYRLLFSTLQRFAAHTTTQHDDKLIQRMRYPARALVLVMAWHTIVLMRGMPYPTLLHLILAIELLLFSYLLIESMETLILDYWLEERQQILVPPVIRQLILVILYTMVGLSILATLTGVNMLPVMATSTVLTVVLGLALQDTLGNLFAGLSLQAEHPFRIGDWILVDKQEGKVTYMGWRSTHLRTFSGDIVVFPNAFVAKARIQNFYAPQRITARCVDFLFTLEAPPDMVEQVVIRAIKTVPDILEEPRTRIWLIAVSPLFQHYRMKVHVPDFQRHDDLESDVMKAIWKEAQSSGILVKPATAAIATNDGGHES